MPRDARLSPHATRLRTALRARAHAHPRCAACRVRSRTLAAMRRSSASVSGQACQHVVRRVHAQHLFAGREEALKALPPIAEQRRTAGRCPQTDGRTGSSHTLPWPAAVMFSVARLEQKNAGCCAGSRCCVKYRLPLHGNSSGYCAPPIRNFCPGKAAAGCRNSSVNAAWRSAAYVPRYEKAERKRSTAATRKVRQRIDPSQTAEPRCARPAVTAARRARGRPCSSAPGQTRPSPSAGRYARVASEPSAFSVDRRVHVVERTHSRARLQDPPRGQHAVRAVAGAHRQVRTGKLSLRPCLDRCRRRVQAEFRTRGQLPKVTRTRVVGHVTLIKRNRVPRAVAWRQSTIAKAWHDRYPQEEDTVRPKTTIRIAAPCMRWFHGKSSDEQPLLRGCFGRCPAKLDRISQAHPPFCDV